jgi:hypothetical protein
MWINSKDWKDIKDRLAALERKHDAHVSDVVMCRNFTVYGPEGEKVYSQWAPNGWYNHYPKQDVAVKDVVQKILDSLGMKLTYVEGKPQTVDLVKVKK